MRQATKPLPTANNRSRQAALALLREGRATLVEISALAGISRQGVRHWAITAGIDVQAARDRYLARAWREAGGGT
jgi:hypothetical protein